MPDQINNRIEESLNNLLSDMYKEHNIKNGDISPLLSLEWDNLVNQMADIFKKVIGHNKP